MDRETPRLILRIYVIIDDCLLATLSINSKCVNIVRWSRDGILLASGSDDNYILIHRLAINSGRTFSISFQVDSLKCQ